MPCALVLALPSAGNSMLARMAMIAMTTNSSINVKAPIGGSGFESAFRSLHRDRSLTLSCGEFTA